MHADSDRLKETLRRWTLLLGVLQITVGCVVGFIPPSAVAWFRGVVMAHIEFVVNGMLMIVLGLLVREMRLGRVGRISEAELVGGERARRRRPQAPEEVRIGLDEALEERVSRRWRDEPERQLDPGEEERHRQQHEGEPHAGRVGGTRAR